MQFSEEELTPVGLLFCIFFYHFINFGTPILFSDLQNEETIKMNLWAKAKNT
jgi:hypothetical protein